jgi:excisionase family DNA binding protein
MLGLISTKEAAEKLGISIRRVQTLIACGKLPANKIGSTYVINQKDLELLDNRKVGRPKKIFVSVTNSSNNSHE